MVVDHSALARRLGKRLREVRLDDGRAMSVPVAWVPQLADATIAQARGWSVTDAGQTLCWPALGAGLTMRVLARGRSGAKRGAD